MQLIDNIFEKNENSFFILANENEENKKNSLQNPKPQTPNPEY